MSVARLATSFSRSAPLATLARAPNRSCVPARTLTVAARSTIALHPRRVESAAPITACRCAHLQCSASPQPGRANMYTVEERGSLYSPNYRVYIKDSKGPISPLHDIPLWADRAQRELNMVVEVPRWTNAKMEMSLGDRLNPIKQDMKKGAVRFVGNVFPHHGYMWNYGALPQTWEDPRHVDPSTQARGDNDPIDVIEIGQRVASRGEVMVVRVLGALALIDEGETDWKLIAVCVTDPDAERLHDVADVEALYPGLLRATVEWFRLYKVPDGKPINRFAFDGEAKDAAFAYNIIDQVHESWRQLMHGEVSDPNDISMMNVTMDRHPKYVEREHAARVLASEPELAAPQPMPQGVHKWHFVSGL